MCRKNKKCLYRLCKKFIVGNLEYIKYIILW